MKIFFAVRRVALVFILLMGVQAQTAIAQVETELTKSEPASGDRAETTPTTWLVVRHAEREGEADKLSDVGKERAAILQQLGRILNVNAIYSTDTVRTRDTALPLATELGIEIQAYNVATATWLNEIRDCHAGDVVLIVGHSNTAGVIAGQLAALEPFEIQHDDYDSLFVIVTPGGKQEGIGSENHLPDNELSNVNKPSVVRLKYGSSSQGAPSAAADQMGPIK